jgi:hypothetical protein
MAPFFPHRAAVVPKISADRQRRNRCGAAANSCVRRNARAMRIDEQVSYLVQPLGESGNLDRYASPQLPLIATAIAAVVILVGV